MYRVPVATTPHASMHMPLKKVRYCKLVDGCCVYWKIWQGWMLHRSHASMQLMPLHWGHFYEDRQMMSFELSGCSGSSGNSSNSGDSSWAIPRVSEAASAVVMAIAESSVAFWNKQKNEWWCSSSRGRTHSYSNSVFISWFSIGWSSIHNPHDVDAQDHCKQGHEEEALPVTKQFWS